jgi:hypothetical protein
MTHQEWWAKDTDLDIHYWLKQFAEALETPDMLTKYEQMREKIAILFCFPPFTSYQIVVCIYAPTR